MKLSPNFLIHVQDDEHLLIPVSDAKFSGVVRGNKTFGAILACLKEETTEEQIVESLKAQFEGAEVNNSYTVSPPLPPSLRVYNAYRVTLPVGV